MLDTRPADTQHALRRLNDLATGEFRERAAVYEEERRVPVETLQAIHELGLLHATPTVRNGGLGGSLLGDDPGLFLEILRILCRGDAAAARVKRRCKRPPGARRRAPHGKPHPEKGRIDPRFRTARPSPAERPARGWVGRSRRRASAVPD